MVYYQWVIVPTDFLKEDAMEDWKEKLERNREEAMKRREAAIAKKGDRHMKKKVETNLEQILSYCQDQADHVKGRDKAVDNAIKKDMLDCGGYEEWMEKVEKAREEYNRAYSQLIGMLSLAQAIYDPKNKVGYFTIDRDEEDHVDKVKFELYEYQL